MNKNNLIAELRNKVLSLSIANERAQATIDLLRSATGPHKCPVCKERRAFVDFPKEPRFIVGRNLRQCRFCHSKRIVQVQIRTRLRKRGETK